MFFITKGTKIIDEYVPIITPKHIMILNVCNSPLENKTIDKAAKTVVTEVMIVLLKLRLILVFIISFVR